jgi:hypothetical protein
LIPAQRDLLSLSPAKRPSPNRDEKRQSIQTPHTNQKANTRLEHRRPQNGHKQATGTESDWLCEKQQAAAPKRKDFTKTHTKWNKSLTKKKHNREYQMEMEIGIAD